MRGRVHLGSRSLTARLVIRPKHQSPHWPCISCATQPPAGRQHMHLSILPSGGSHPFMFFLVPGIIHVCMYIECSRVNPSSSSSCLSAYFPPSRPVASLPSDAFHLPIACPLLLQVASCHQTTVSFASPSPRSRGHCRIYCACKSTPATPTIGRVHVHWHGALLESCRGRIMMGAMMISAVLGLHEASSSRGGVHG